MKKNLVAIFALVFATSALCTEKGIRERVTLAIRILALNERIRVAEQERALLLQMGMRKEFSHMVKYTEKLYRHKQRLMVKP